MLANIPGPLNVVVDSEGETSSYPIKVFNNRIVEKGAPLISDFETRSDGSVSKINAPQIKYIGGYFHFWISSDEEGNDKISDVRWVLPDDENQDTLIIKTGDFDLVAGNDYYFHYRFRNNNQISFESILLKKADLDDDVIPIELSFENQKPGIYSGKIKFTNDHNNQINQIIIQKFQAHFLSSTAEMRVSILKEGDENNPLASSERSIEFSNPGEHFSEEFIFSQIYLDKETKYLVKFELLGGNAIQLLAENFTLETSWDDSLPLNVDKVNVGGIYSPFNLELYQDDTPEKRDRMIEILDKSEYIVVPSNRGYDAMPRLVTRYPLTLKYYQLLFDCNCSGDEMEKRAFGLEPPFISPLGFELIAIFVSHPNLGPIHINDQNADESFTVYDHPKVFIFKKTDSFSLEKVKQELFDVDLDKVIFQKPIDVSRAENGLKLSDDRLLVQTSGGTWSEIFIRDSLINQNPVITVVAWYFFIFVIGWIVLPLTVHLFQGIPDKGYSLIRIVSLLLLTWFTWLSGSLKVLSFSKSTILFWILLLTVINIVWFYRRKHQILEYIRLNWRYIIFVEVIFLLLFIFSLHIRIANPDLWHPWYGGEKPMEFAFFNSVNKAVFFPPQNPWFSEHYINYYYYGYIIAAIPTKLLGILPSIAFNLILPTWFGMTGLGVFGIGYNLYLGFKKKENLTEINVEYNRQLERRAFFNFQSLHLPAYFAGIFTLIFILFLGNFYQLKLLWDYLPDVSTVVQDVDSDNKLISVISGAQNVLSGDTELPGSPGRWYFSASRPILHDGPDTPIAEFPYFSFLYGDLHPHLLSMPFYALGFAWCLSLLLTPLHHKRRYQQIFLMIMAGLIFGFFRVTHTWDFPIFIGLGILSITWMFIKDKKLGFEQQVKKNILYVLFFIVLSVILYLPFTYWFKTAYNSIEIWKGAKTPLFDYFIVFGMAIFIMFAFLMDELKSNISRIVNNWQKMNIGKLVIPLLILIIMVLGTLILWKTNYQVLAFAWPLLISWVWIIFFKNEVRDFRKLIWSLFAIGFSITFIVEVFVLKGDVGRSNMVFRMYNIAWFILGIAMSTALIEIRNNLKRYPKFIEICWLLIFLILLILGLTYQLTATNKKMNDRWPNVESPPRTLDGSLYMLGNPTSSGVYTPALYKENEIDLDLSLDYEAIQFIQDTIIGSPVIVEGHTSIYRWGARYSIYTGLPTVIGWEWHTIQHNSLLDRAVVDKRIERVKEFYNTTDLKTAKDFINRFSVKYIVISGLERAIYSAEGLDKFNTMVENGELSIIYGESKTDTAIIYEVSMK
jgi:YYY domain-containing protein